jgi:uncharacterized protein YbjT (DUF2867 family)
MSNALFWARSIKAERVVRTATGDGKIPFIHPRDIADVTAQVLTIGYISWDQFPPYRSRSARLYEMAAKIGAVIGKPLRRQPISNEEVRQQQMAWGAPEPEIEAHISIYHVSRDPGGTARGGYLNRGTGARTKAHHLRRIG